VSGPVGAPPRPAATVVVLREQAGAVEVLMVQRTRGASFMADAWVFPGGRLDPADGDPADEGTFRRAAARELLEEAGLAIAPEALVPFAHWITPSVEPKRFDTRFYLTALPDGSAPAAIDGQETVAMRWATPAALLADHDAGRLKIPPPTWATLEDLAPRRSIADAFAWARAQVIAPILPKLVLLDGGGLAIYLPWDPDYAATPGEGRPLPPDHPLAAAHANLSRFVLDEGRWWARPPR
jgi:8-oxo-dGTP pyrophosphatase MutT (NUDIX family)